MLDDVINLLRVKQWYKNLIFFVPLIFSSNLFNTNKLLLSLAGFLSLCLVSSANYVINDLFDYKRDKRNPLKKNRPLVKGVISKGQAVIIALVLLSSSIIISSLLPNGFLLFPLLLFISTSLYTIGLKGLPIIDLLIIGVNFFIRTYSGGVLISVPVTNWLVLMIFLTAVLLALSKRYSSLVKLGVRAVRVRPVFKYYSANLLKYYIIMVSSTLLVSYCLYSFLSDKPDLLMFSIPFFMFIIMRYLMLVLSGARAGINAELVFTDKQFAVGFIAWLISVLIIFY